MQHATRRKPCMQALHQAIGERPFVFAQGSDIPLSTVHVVNRHKSRLAALGQTHVAVFQLGVDAAPELLHRLPLRLGIGFGDARVFVDARH